MGKIIDRLKGAFFALTHDTETISLNDDRFWQRYGRSSAAKPET